MARPGLISVGTGRETSARLPFCENGGVAILVSGLNFFDYFAFLSLWWAVAAPPSSASTGADLLAEVHFWYMTTLAETLL